MKVRQPRPLSLRDRLLVGVLVVVVVLVASDVVVSVVVRSYLVGRVDRQLAAARPAVSALVRRGSAPRAATPRATIAPGARPQQLSDLFIEVLQPDGSVLTRVDPALQARGDSPPLVTPALVAQHAAPPGSAGVPFTVRAEKPSGPHYRVIIDALARGTGSSVVALSLRETDATFRRIVVVEALATAAALLALTAVAIWEMHGGVRPLVEMAVTAGAIADGDLSRRVSRADGRSEVGRLGIALNAMLGQIESAFRARQASEDGLRRFVADASHELRTPLTSIQGYADLWRQGGIHDDAELGEAMRRIEEEAIRMGDLVDDMLLLARLDQGRPLDRAPVDLSRLAMDAARDARAVEPERPIAVQADHPVVVMGDEGRLRQLTSNLVTNAREHTPPGTPVTIDVYRRNGHAVLEVADRGPGIEAEAAGRVFERFYRVSPSRTRAHGGTGLGLSIVAAVAAAHGGHAAVNTKPGDGARFTVELPMDPSPR